jgi:hypothetical protein
MSEESKGKIEVQRAILPEGVWDTVQDMDDVNIWLRFNIVLQGNAENVVEHGEAGDGTRQLRILAQECVRRKMFERRIEYHKMQGTLNEALLLTWYEVLGALLQGENEGTWETEGDTNREYTLVIKELQALGVQMPGQRTRLDPLHMIGKIIT